MPLTDSQLLYNSKLLFAGRPLKFGTEDDYTKDSLLGMLRRVSDRSLIRLLSGPTSNTQFVLELKGEGHYVEFRDTPEMFSEFSNVSTQRSDVASVHIVGQRVKRHHWSHNRLGLIAETENRKQYGLCPTDCKFYELKRPVPDEELVDLDLGIFIAAYHNTVCDMVHKIANQATQNQLYELQIADGKSFNYYIPYIKCADEQGTNCAPQVLRGIYRYVNGGRSIYVPRTRTKGCLFGRSQLAPYNLLWSTGSPDVLLERLMHNSSDIAGDAQLPELSIETPPVNTQRRTMTTANQTNTPLNIEPDTTIGNLPDISQPAVAITEKKNATVVTASENKKKTIPITPVTIPPYTKKNQHMPKELNEILKECVLRHGLRNDKKHMECYKKLEREYKWPWHVLKKRVANKKKEWLAELPAERQSNQ
jgi:hypothetical protein